MSISAQLDTGQLDMQPEVAVLGQLLTAEGVLCVLPTKEKIAEFVSQAVRSSLPGRPPCSLCVRGCTGPIGDLIDRECTDCASVRSDSPATASSKCDLIGRAGTVGYPMATSEQFYGYLLLKADDDEQLAPYEPFLANFANAVATTLENRWQQDTLIAQLKNKNAELERFAYSVSHDLKSPLITISGFVGLLHEDLGDDCSELVQNHLQRISQATQKMCEMLDETLDLSRAGRLVTAPKKVNFADLAAEAVAQVAGLIEQAGVEVEIEPDLPDLHGDPSRLCQVMQNLVENAVKYIGDQPNPRIMLGARRELDKNVFLVRDNGMGIDPKYHEKVFGLFDKLNGHSEGNGIGLALVKRIVEVHGGRIWVESEGSGKGATFCFTVEPKKTVSAV